MFYIAGGLNQPKWGHLKDLHLLLKSLEKIMLYGTATTKTFDKDNLESVYFYSLCHISIRWIKYCL